MEQKVIATYEAVQVGEHLGPVHYEITKEDVTMELEKMQDNGEHLTMPNGRRAAPPTIINGNCFKVWRTKYSMFDVVHTKANLSFLRPIVPPLKVTASGVTVDKYIRRGREYCVLETVTRDDLGNELTRARDVLLINASVRHQGER